MSGETTTPLNVVRVVFEFPPTTGGSITNTVELCTKMEDCLRSQTIITPEIEGDTSETDSDLGLDIVRVPYCRRLEHLGRLGLPVRPIVLLSFARAAKKAIMSIPDLRRHPLVIHVHGTLLGAIMGLLLKSENPRLPLVITQDSANPLKISLRETLVVWLSLILFTFRKPDCIMVIDDGTGIQEYFSILGRRGIRSERILHAVDIPDNEQLGTRNQSEFIVVSTSRLVPFKRVDLTIRAFALFSKHMEPMSARLKIVGAGRELASLKELSLELDIAHAVDFEGEKQHNEISNILFCSDVMIGTSTISNLNLSIQEAMAHGLPVIAFDNGEMQSLMTHMRDGILVKSGDVKGMAEALALLHDNEDLRREISRNASLRIKNERDWSRRLSREVECYRNCIFESSR